MTRVGFRMKIKPEFREEYVKVHQHVDTALTEEYRMLGVTNYSIFLHEDGTLFAYMECRDWAAFETAVQRSPNQAAWAKKVYRMFEKKPDEEGGMVLLTEAFHMDEKDP